jgi:hypothetical protein
MARRAMVVAHPGARGLLGGDDSGAIRVARSLLERRSGRRSFMVLRGWSVTVMMGATLGWAVMPGCSSGGSSSGTGGRGGASSGGTNSGGASGAGGRAQPSGGSSSTGGNGCEGGFGGAAGGAAQGGSAGTIGNPPCAASVGNGACCRYGSTRSCLTPSGAFCSCGTSNAWTCGNI